MERAAAEPRGVPEDRGGAGRDRSPGPRDRRRDRRRREGGQRAARDRRGRDRPDRGVGDLPGPGQGRGGADPRGDRGGRSCRGGRLMAETILVVDDDPDIARFVEVNLRSAGYDVSVAGDGEEALERAAELRPDLVLLDVMMPRLDGFEVAQRLRKNPQTANTS